MERRRRVDGDSDWGRGTVRAAPFSTRTVCARLLRRGYGHLGGYLSRRFRARWHLAAQGVTAQIALVPIGDAEVTTSNGVEFVDNSGFVSGISAKMAVAPSMRTRWRATRLPKLALAAPQRPLYDVITGLHADAWSALRPALNALATVDESASERLARQLIEGGLTPPVVHLTADVGCLTLYDSAMVHRGGRNTGATARPILAVHLRAGSEYGPGEDTPGVQR